MLEELTPSLEITMFLIELSRVSIFLEYAKKKTLSQISSSNLKVSFAASRIAPPKRIFPWGRALRDKTEIKNVF